MTILLAMSSHASDPSDDSAKTHCPEVEVWHAPAAMEEPGPMEVFCERLLLAEERVRADRFRVASARHQHVIGRAMARVLLSAGHCQTHEVGFRVLDHGKPIMESPAHACRSFNIAHTRGLVLCGLGAPQQWLGVDVEWMDRRTDPELARRYFAPEEIRQLDATSNQDDHRELFLRLWTLKEAFIKAIGTGMYTPLDQFAFEDAASDQPRLVVRDVSLMRQRRWHFENFVPQPGFVAAIAVSVDTSVGAVPHERPKLRLANFNSHTR